MREQREVSRLRRREKETEGRRDGGVLSCYYLLYCNLMDSEWRRSITLHLDNVTFVLLI